MDERIEICALCKMGLLYTVVLDILLSCLKIFQNSKLVEAAIDRQYFVRIIYNWTNPKFLPDSIRYLTGKLVRHDVQFINLTYPTILLCFSISIALSVSKSRFVFL